MSESLWYVVEGITDGKPRAYMLSVDPASVLLDLPGVRASLSTSRVQAAERYELGCRMTVDRVDAALHEVQQSHSAAVALLNEVRAEQ